MDNRTFNVKPSKVMKPIPNGPYTGKIVAVEYRDVPYKGKNLVYADLTISLNEMTDTTVVAGMGANEITPTTELGKLINAYSPIVEGQVIDPVAMLIGKPVSLVIANMPGKSDPTKFYPGVVKKTVTAIIGK